MESSEARMKKRLAISLNIYVVFKLEEPETEILLRSPRLLDLIKANKFSHLKNRRTIFESFFFFLFLYLFFFPISVFHRNNRLTGAFCCTFWSPSYLCRMLYFWVLLCHFAPSMTLKLHYFLYHWYRETKYPKTNI